MKNIITIMLLCIACLSCKTSSTLRSITKVSKDSTAKVAKQSTDQNDSFYHHTTVEDTAVGVSGDDAKLSLSAAETKPQPCNDGSCTEAPKTYTSKSGRTTATAIVNPDGSMIIDCKTDSLTIVIKRLIKDSVYQRQRFDSLRFIKILTAHSDTTDDVSVTKTVTTLWGKYWIWILVLIVCIVIYKLFPFILKFINHHAG